MKLSRSRVENGGSNSKSKMEANSGQGNMAAEKHTKPSEQPNKQDYIHVRARRGQATDSHSLAERVISLQSCWNCYLSFVEFICRFLFAD